MQESKEADAVSPSPPGEVTRLLLAWRQGDDRALEQLIPLVYGELHRMAERYLRQERPGHTLQPTAIVHEAYLRLLGRQHEDWQSRTHFFAVAAQSMRRILVEHARARNAKKRGGQGTRWLLDTVLLPEHSEVDLIALDDALLKLGELDPQQGRVVELRFFGGLTEDEAGEVLGVSPRTITRKWRLAKAFLYRELSKTL
jgi:RNA polymerase sigma factor (TIGR02999 family)